MNGSSIIQTTIDDFSNRESTDIIAYFGDVSRSYDDVIIDLCKGRKRRKNALLLLETYGGDANAAYRIARCLQEAYKTIPFKDRVSERKKEGKFSVFINGICKSAGTIICLGADELIMTGNSELGPIDAQLRKSEEVGERTSGLTPIQAIQFLESQSIQLFRRHFRALRDPNFIGFSTKMAAEIATNISVGLLTSIYGQVDPIRLAEVDRSLRIAKEYGDRIKTDNVKDDTIEKLLAKYPSHGFVIDRKEAKELFNKVLKARDNHSEIIKIMDFFKPVLRYYVDNGESFVHFLSSEPQIAESSSPDETPDPIVKKGGPKKKALSDD